MWPSAPRAQPRTRTKAVPSLHRCRCLPDRRVRPGFVTKLGLVDLDRVTIERSCQSCDRSSAEADVYAGPSRRVVRKRDKTVRTRVEPAVTGWHWTSARPWGVTAALTPPAMRLLHVPNLCESAMGGARTASGAPEPSARCASPPQPDTRGRAAVFALAEPGCLRVRRGGAVEVAPGRRHPGQGRTCRCHWRSGARSRDSRSEASVTSGCATSKSGPMVVGANARLSARHVTGNTTA